jgi:Mg-chelatase subunit ChlD
LLIALISLALVRPRIFSDRTGGSIGPNQTVKAVVVIDTSASMDYNSGGKSRLDDAKQRAIELLDEFHENSRIAIVDTSDPGREWMSPSQAREKVRSLTTKAGSQSVTTALSVAYDVFLTPDPAINQSDNDDLPRFLYVLGDRMVASWDGSRTSDLAARRDKLQPPDIVSFFVDVGVEKPIDVAITSVDLKSSRRP